MLAGVRHLLVVPDGPLQSLPLAVLVRSAPAAGEGYRTVDWLARTYATTTLPSVSSLRVLRRLAPPSRAAEPFRAVGDPVLAGPGGPARGSAAVVPLLARGLADPAQVRALPRCRRPRTSYGRWPGASAPTPAAASCSATRPPRRR
jgi:hypothetical protein